MSDAPAPTAEAVRTVAAGDAPLAPGITRRLIAGFSRLGTTIAQRLVVAEQTVKTHVGRILVKRASATAPRQRSSPTSPACSALLDTERTPAAHYP